MKAKDNLKGKARLCRAHAENECQSFNDEEEKTVVSEFEKGETAKYFRNNGRYVIGLVVKRLEVIKKGEKPYPLRPFDAETMARLLSTCTEAPYDAKGFDENLSDEETVKLYESGNLVHEGYSTSAETSASELQRELCYALYEYATAAAVYAKHISSGSLLEWAEMVDILEDHLRWLFPSMNSNKALRIVELEKSAANRLRLDMVIAGLPPYKKAKKGR